MNKKFKVVQKLILVPGIPKMRLEEHFSDGLF